MIVHYKTRCILVLVAVKRGLLFTVLSRPLYSNKVSGLVALGDNHLLSPLSSLALFQHSLDYLRTDHVTIFSHKNTMSNMYLGKSQ